MTAPIDDLSTGRKPDTTYWTAKTAAKRLGVSRELVEGLVRNKSLDGYVDVGTSGHPVVMVEIDVFFLEALKGYSLG